MPPECTWIIAREEAHSEGICGSYIQILSAIANDNLLDSEQVIWSFLPTEGDCTELLEVTMEGVTDGKCNRPRLLDGRAESRDHLCQTEKPMSILE